MLKEKQVFKYNKNHKQIGLDLELFFFSNTIPGQVFYLSRGLLLIRNIQDFIRKKLIREHFIEVCTPSFAGEEIWGKSGHLKKFSTNMFEINEGKNFLKPMNCPLHRVLFENIFKFKELPIKLFEFSFCYRNEDLSGLFRLKRFMQDDVHIVCERSDIYKHFALFEKMIYLIYKYTCKLEYSVYLSLSSNENLNHILENLLQESNLIKESKNDSFIIDEEGGAFYGPKIDIFVGKWQLGTFQIDEMNVPRKGSIVIHHAFLGTFERFIAVLLETLDKIPFLFNPRKIYVITTKDIQKLDDNFKDSIINNLGLSIESQDVIVKREEILFDERNEDINTKIKRAIHKKPSFICIVGKKEIESNSLNFRMSDKKNKSITHKNVTINNIKSFIEQYNNY